MAAGDFYIRKNTSDTTAVPNAGSNEDSGWYTVERDVGSIVSYTDPNFQLDIGTYLIMYSEYFETTDVTNNERIEIQGEIHVSGTGVVGGYGQGYIRKSSGDQECVVRGQHILRVTSDNTDVFVRFYRTDNSTTGTVNRVPGNGGVIILELDNNDNFAFYSNSATHSITATDSTFNFNTNDRQDTGFSNSGAGVITITNAGRYLVQYSIDISQTSTGREDVRAWLTVNGTATVEVGTYGYCYSRGSDGCQDGALSWIGIIDVAASDTIQVRCDVPTTATFTGATNSRLQFWQIPSGGDECIINATNGDYSNAATGFAWDTVPHIDTASFTHTAGNSNLDIDQRDHLLVFATFSQQGTDTVQRGVPFTRFQLDDTDLDYMCGDVYHRNSGGSGLVAVNVAGIVHDVVTDASLEVSTEARAASGALNNDSGQFSALSLEALYGGYSYLPIITDFNTTEQFNWGDTNLVITGVDFGATQGSGMVEIWSDQSGTTKVTQTIDTWSATSIQIDTVQGALSGDTTLYLVVTTDAGDESNIFEISEGLTPYHELIVDSLNADHYWRLNNTYDDTGDTGPTRNMTSGVVGTWTFSSADADILSDSNTHSVVIDSVTERREIADSANMNITDTHAERTLAFWFKINNIQQPMAAIWKEGGGVQNLAFIIGLGNQLMFQLADVAGTRDNVQAFSDIRLTPNRPYHICGRYSNSESPAEARLFIDGVEQASTDGNPMTINIFDTHSGDVTWNDPDNNLETGGTDIAYNGLEDANWSDWCTWSDNSAGTNAGGLDKVTEIRDILFRRGARPAYTISADTSANMQSDLDTQLSDSEVEDWPLGIRVEAPTDGSDLELVFDNITFNSRTTDHLEWRGSGELTIVLENGSSIDSNKVWSQTGGTINIIDAPAVTITCRDAADISTTIQNVRVLLLADTGGPLPFEDSVTITRSGSTATVTHTAHGMSTGDEVVIQGANENEYNGIQSITVTGTNSYTYTVSGTPATPATGTIIATAVIINGVSDVSGEISVNFRFSSNQPVSGRGRQGSTSVYRKTGNVSGTITSSGFNGSILLIRDE